MTWKLGDVPVSRGKSTAFSEADDAFIIEQWNLGKKTRWIGENLPTPRNKNKVVGRAHRLRELGFDLEKRQNPTGKELKPQRAPRPPKRKRDQTIPPLPSAVVAPKPPPPKPVLVAPPVPVERPPRPMRANNGRGCQFMFETGRWPRYEPCGAPRVCHPATGVVQSWCDEHAGKVFAHWSRFKATERQDIAA